MSSARKAGWRRSLTAVGALTAVMGISGCKHDPNVQKRKYLESGIRYEKEGKLREAAIQFSNALKVDRNYSAAHYELAKTYLQLGSMIAAYQELQRTVSLDPSNVQAKLDLGDMLLAGGLPDRAKDQANAVLKLNANNADAYALLSHIAQRQKDHAQALSYIQRALAIDPNKAAYHTSLGLLESSTEEGKQAGEQELQKAVALNPKDPSAHLALAATYARSNNIEAAEQQAAAGVQVAPDNLQARMMLAELYLHAGDQAHAEQTLVSAVDQMPDKDQPANLLLSFYGQTKQIPHADQVFADLNKRHPKSVAIQTAYARVLLLEGKFDQASSVLQELNKANSNNPQVQRLNADLLLHQGKTNDAFNLLQKAVGNAPDDVRLHMLLAQTAASLGKNSIAESNIREAAQLDPNNVQAAQAMAELALQHNDMEQLSQLADKMIKLHPDAPDGYIWRGTAEARQQQDTQAENDIKTALQKDPNNAVANLALGELRIRQKRFPEATTLLQQVLDRNPNQLQALHSLISLDLAAKQPEKALALVQEQIAKSPNNPALYTDLSSLQLSQKDIGGAEASAQHALSLNPGYEVAVQAYSEAAIAAGNTDAAIAAWQHWLSAHPDDPRAEALLGSLEETKGDINKATDYYKKALAIDSSQAIAANNLAYLMVENGENTDIALSYAETARRSLPNAPNTADTLAWVYYHKGTYSLARDLLQDAVKADPENAAMHYHLGMTYSKLGNKTDATTELKKATELAPNSNVAKQASQALGQLG